MFGLLLFYRNFKRRIPNRPSLIPDNLIKRRLVLRRRVQVVIKFSCSHRAVLVS